MKRFIIFLHLFFICIFTSAQIKDWKGILSGDFLTLKNENIKTLILRKDGKISRKMEIGENNIILFIDSNPSKEFYFDNIGRLVKYKILPQISINFLGNGKIQSYSNVGEGDVNYEFDENSREILFERKIPVDGIKKLVDARYFIKNKMDSTLSYQEFFNKNERSRYYQDHKTKVTFRSLTDYNVAEINDRQIAKDSLISGKKEEEYYFNKNNELISKRIVRDSIYQTGYENNKLEYYYVEFKGNRYYYEQYRNGILDVKIKNRYYPTKNGNIVLWEVLRFDISNKKKYKEYPNKHIYKLKKNVLVERNNLESLRIIGCGGYAIPDRKNKFNYYLMQTFSPSILFDEKLRRNFVTQFDTYDISSQPEIINAIILFNQDPTLSLYTNDSATNTELIRTSKTFFRRIDKWNTYFNDFKVEAITNNNKKYLLNLTGEFKNFTFPIHIILTQY